MGPGTWRWGRYRVRVASPYRELLRIPGGWKFSLAGFFGRLPLSMGGVALLLLIVDYSDSYFVGGAVEATWIVVEASAAPAIARLVDRFGQARIVGPQITLHLVSVTTLVVLVSKSAPQWSFFVAAAACGATLPVVGSFVRARWTALLGESALLRSAFSWESVVDEFVFIIGPPLATFVSATIGPSQAVLITACIGASGTYALIAQRTTEPQPAPHTADRGPLATSFAGMKAVLVVMAALGLLFAGVEVTVIATARENGETFAAGIVLAIWSVSSMLVGLVIGGLKNPPPLYRQLLIGSVGLAVALVPLLASQGLITTAVILFFAGAAVSPTLIAGFTLVERLVPPHRLTEALPWASTALAIGFALGSAASGWLVDHVSLGAGYWVGVVSALLAVLATLASKGVLERPVHINHPPTVG